MDWTLHHSNDHLCSTYYLLSKRTVSSKEVTLKNVVMWIVVCLEVLNIYITHCLYLWFWAFLLNCKQKLLISVQLLDVLLLRYKAIFNSWLAFSYYHGINQSQVFWSTHLLTSRGLLLFDSSQVIQPELNTENVAVCPGRKPFIYIDTEYVPLESCPSNVHLNKLNLLTTALVLFAVLLVFF